VGEGGSAVCILILFLCFAAESDEVVSFLYFFKMTTSSVTPPFLFHYRYYAGGATASPTGEASLFISFPLYFAIPSFLLVSPHR
jgi:hypothetical protein